MPNKTVVCEDAPQVRMPAEHDAEQIESFALVPVGSRPDHRNGVKHREIIVLGKYSQAQARIQLDGQEVVNHREARAFPTASTKMAVVQSAEVQKGIEAQPWPIPQDQGG